ncbi:putative ribonuclease H-like domain-containing protein [Tanacetum coccineum]
MNYEPVTAGKQTNSDAGIETNINVGQAGQEKASDHEYILLPLILSNSPRSSSTQSTDDKDTDEVPDKGDDDLSQRNGQENPNINTASPIPNDSSMQSLENTGIFDDAYDDRELGAESDLNNLETTMNVSLIPTTRIHKDHPKDQIIRDINSTTQTRRMTEISKEHAMVYRNKKDDRGIVVRNKARLVAQGYTQEEGIDYDEVFAPVARIEAIRLFLANASFMGFIVYQMDIKSAFLYGTIKEEVYVCQPPSFEDPQFPDKVYKVENALYGLRQALRAWYETLSTYLLGNRFRRGTIDKTLFIKKDKGDILLQVQQKEDEIFIIQDKYVADILKKFDFITINISSTLIKTNKALLKDEEAEDVDVHLYRSMIGSLMYLTASRPDIMFAVCACARFQVTPKVSHLHAMNSIFRYLKGQPKLGLWYPRDSLFDLEALAKDETVYNEWEDKMERAAITASSLEVEQDSEAQIRFKTASKQSNDPPLSRVNTLRSGDDSIKLMELMEHCTKLSELKRKESNGFEEIIDFLNASSFQYALMVNPTIYTTCIEQFWTSAKLDDAKGTYCLPTATIFTELERMGYENLTQKLTFYKAYFSSQWKFPIHTILQCLCAKTKSWNEFSSTMASAIICLATNKKFNLSKYIFDNMVKNLDGGVKFLMYPRFVQVFLDKQVEGMSKHKEVYVIPSHTKKVFANMKRPCKGFSGRGTPLFSTMMVQATEDMGADSTTPTDSYSTPIITQPSSSKPQKKKSRRKQRKDSAPTEPTTKETTPEEHVSTPSYDPPPSGEDRLQLAELMSLCTNLQEKLEQIRKSRTSGLRRLRKVGSSSSVESSNDVSLGAQEDASKYRRKIDDLDADAKVTLVDETQEMHDDNLMFDTSVLEEQEIEIEKVVEEPVISAADLVSTAGDVVTTASANVEVPDELTLAQTLIEIKTAKPKPVTTTATTVTSVRPRAKGIIFHDQEEQVFASTKTCSSSQSQLPQVKDKGKGKLGEPKVPLKKKDQVALDEEMA